MLVEYKGERFRVSERTYEQFSIEYPERARKLKIIKESEKIYNFDKLLQLIEPEQDKIKQTIIENYIYAEDKYDEHTLNEQYDEMQKYFGAKEMVRKIGIELINYDPEQHHETITENRERLKQKDKEYQEWLKKLHKTI